MAPRIRSHIRRLSLAIGIGKPYTPAPSVTTLAQFLSSSKEKYLADIHALPPKGGEWTVVMGNEAGDLDSIASSIAFAWIHSSVHNKPTIPLIQTRAEDFTLRPENIHALSLAGITSPSTQLLTLTDLASITPFPSHTFALVDHNRLGGLYSSTPSAEVTAVIDHHDDEGLYLNASPRTITPCGSCASLIALLCPPDVPPELATLLLTAILIDTSGLKPGGKALATDVQAATFLAPRSTHGPSFSSSLFKDPTPDWTKAGKKLSEAPTLKVLTKELKTKKDDVSLLSGRDLLRRDYKDYTYTLPWAEGHTIKAGLSSVPISLEAMGKKGKLEEAMALWMKEQGIAVLGVLTSFRGGSTGNKKHRREMAWMVYAADPVAQPVDFEELAQKLWKGLEDSGELKVKKHKKVFVEKSDGMKARAYKQGNSEANRKVIAPLLKNTLVRHESLKGNESSGQPLDATV